MKTQTLGNHFVFFPYSREAFFSPETPVSHTCVKSNCLLPESDKTAVSVDAEPAYYTHVDEAN